MKGFAQEKSLAIFMPKLCRIWLGAKFTYKHSKVQHNLGINMAFLSLSVKIMIMIVWISDIKGASTNLLVICKLDQYACCLKFDSKEIRNSQCWYFVFSAKNLHDTPPSLVPFHSVQFVVFYTQTNH